MPTPNTKVNYFFLENSNVTFTQIYFSKLKDFLFLILKSCKYHSHDLEGPPAGGEDEDPVSTHTGPERSSIGIHTINLHSGLHIPR